MNPTTDKEPRTVIIRIPHGYEDAESFCNDCGFEKVNTRSEQGWMPIMELPVNIGKRMFVVRAIKNDGYVTDPWCVWQDGPNFVRWPHPFPPTMFLLLPPTETQGDSK